MKLRYTPLALADLQTTQSYIADVLKNPAAARRGTKRILDTCPLLKENPELGVSLAAKTGTDTPLRLLVCGKYAAVYRVDGGSISIARIFNCRQDYLRILFGEELETP